MIKMRLVIVFLFSLIVCSATSQIEYSYKNERVIHDQSDLVGYNFRPFKVEIPGSYEPKKIEPGNFSFGITRTRLYVNGDKDIRGLYEIKNISPTIYGYKLKLIDPSNPNSWGHLKVILNKIQEVEALIFKKAKKTTEYIFHLPDASKERLQKEKKYFTDMREVTVEDIDSLWGTTIYPYFRVNLADGIQNRIYTMDSTVISFEEVIGVKEKKKKRFRKKKKNEEEKQEKVSIENVPPDQIIKEYFVNISSVVTDMEGKSEKVNWRFPVRELEEREDPSATKKEERFQIAIKVGKRKEIYLYLMKDRTVSSFEAKGIKYLVRGQ